MISNFLFAAVKAGTPLLFGTVGEIYNEKAGNLNLGVEGMMFMGAFSGFYAGYKSNSLLIAILAAMFAGMLGALIYAFFTVTLKTNQNVTGLTLTIFGSGCAQFFGLQTLAAKGGTAALPDGMKEQLSEIEIPLLSKIPYIGKVFFSHNIFIYLGIAVAILSYLYMKRTKAGLVLRAVGENPATADSAGINVNRIKYIHILIGGAVCGIGGAYLSLINGGGTWNNTCVSGQGWIAVALVIFAAWNPCRALIGSLVFGGFSILQFYVNKGIINIPNAFYTMLPFLVTILVLIITSVRNSQKHSQPAGCGINYFREER